MTLERKQDLQTRARELPDSPGVYAMKDASGKTIYVGKAASLRNRVRSYFQSPQGLPRRTQALVERIADFEYVVTDSEVEALILENNLIKKNRPWFNVRLRDDKTYPFIKLTMADEFPRLVVTRKVEQDGSRYFGPYADVGAMRESIRFLKRLFPIRSCSKNVSEGQESRPCLNYHIRKCLSPCAGRISREAYMELVDQIVLFLEGRQDQAIREMKRRMQTASEALDFETAAAIRDRIRALEKVSERQKVVQASQHDMDIIGFWRDGSDACVEAFFVRRGKLLGRERFHMTNTGESPDEETISAFVKQYYSDAAYIPREVVLPAEPEDREAIALWLRERAGHKVRLTVSRRGEKKQLLDMASTNAKLGLEEARSREMRAAELSGAALIELQKVLGLPRPPERIEAFDISTIQGTDAVGSMVVFEEGRPLKSAYRRFRIRTVEGQDDLAMMHEVISRRHKKRLTKSEPATEPSTEGESRSHESRAQSNAGGKPAQGPLPDLVLVDGGKGQLSAALRALRESGLEGIPAIGLAEAHELVFVETREDPIVLPGDSKALLLLRRVRDEAHRFALAYHRQLRTKRATLSMLEEVPGVGRKRIQALLAAFGSLKAIHEASTEDIASVRGMNRAVAERIRQALDESPPAR